MAKLWKKLLPRSPLKGGVITKDTGVLTNWARSHVKEGMKSHCPQCNYTPLTIQYVVDEHTYDNDTIILDKISRVHLVCDNCGFTDDVTPIIEAAYSNLHSLYKTERLYIMCALGLFIGSIALAVWLQNPFTAISGPLISLVLLSHAFSLNYKRWQIMNSRLFEKKAPIKDYIKDFFKGN